MDTLVDLLSFVDLCVLLDDRAILFDLLLLLLLLMINSSFDLLFGNLLGILSANFIWILFFERCFIFLDGIIGSSFNS